MGIPTAIRITVIIKFLNLRINSNGLVAMSLVLSHINHFLPKYFEGCIN